MLERVWRKGTLLHCWKCKLAQSLWRTVWRLDSLKNSMGIELQYDPAIPLLGIHIKETRIERDTCTPMFITALFTTSRTWNREGNGTPLQYSCLENPMDGGAWWAAVYGVAQSRTRLKRLSSSSSSIPLGICTTTSLSIHLLMDI